MNIKDIEKKIDHRIAGENKAFEDQLSKLSRLRNNKLDEIFTKHFNMFKKINIEELLVSHGFSKGGTLYLPYKEGPLYLPVFRPFEDILEMEESLISNIKNMDEDIFEDYKQEDKKIMLELSKTNGYKIDFVTINMEMYKTETSFENQTTKRFIEMFYKFVSDNSDFKVEGANTYLNGEQVFALCFKEK